MENLHLKIKSFIFALTLFLLHVEEAKGIAINAMPLTMPQHPMRHFYFMRRIELGEKTNFLTLVKINPDKTKHVKHEFLCDCGTTTHATLDNVRRGNVKSCGCLTHKEGRTFKVKKVLIGEKHNLLTLIRIDPDKPYRKGRHIFKCDCGNECSTELKSVRNGHTKSCGCIGKKYDSIRELCIQDYLKGMTYVEAGKKHGVPYTSIKEWVSKEHVGRKCWESRSKYTVDHNAFKEVTPESLYWAGFLAADGWVQEKNKNNKVIGLGLKKSDLGHIEKFREFIKSDLPIKEKKHSFDISVSSVRMANDLAKFGITPRKSLNYSPPEFCLSSPDFWRGMIDGDGSVFQSRGNMMIMLCGSKDAVFGLYNWITTFTDVKAKPYIRSEGFWAFRTSCTYAQKTIQKLYENGGPSLDRKKAAVDGFVGHKACKHIYI